MAAKILTVEKRFWLPGQAPPPAMRGKVFQATKESLGYSDPAAEILRDGIDQSEMSFPAVISTIDEDRVDDSMVPEGCQVENYRRNPVVFFGHQDPPLPIAYARTRDTQQLQVAVEPGRRVLSRAYCVQKGKWAEEAYSIFELMVEGALCGVSIGFNPIEWVNIENSYGRRYTVWDLLEWSVVGVPCNPYCQIVRSYLGRQRSLKPTVRKALEPLAEPLRAWSPGHTPEESAMPKNKTKKRKAKAVPFTQEAKRRMDAAVKAAKEAATKLQEQLAAGEAPYGLCPQCKAPGVSRERRPDGNDKCANGHEYPSKTAVPAAKGNEPPPPPPRDDEDQEREHNDDSQDPPPPPEEKPDLAGLLGQLLTVLDALRDLTTPQAPPPAASTESEDEEEIEEEEETEETEQEEQQEDEDDEEETEELLSGYRGGKASKKKAAVSKGSKPRRKGLTPDHCTALVDAAKCFADFSGIEDDAPFTRTHKAACKLHCRAMTEIIDALAAPDDAGEGNPDDGKGKEGDEPPPPAESQDDKDAAEALEALKSLNGKLEGLGQKVFELTGK